MRRRRWQKQTRVTRGQRLLPNALACTHCAATQQMGEFDGSQAPNHAITHCSARLSPLICAMRAANEASLPRMAFMLVEKGSSQPSIFMASAPC